MNRELICKWLDLSDTDWPPDHYHLLGLRAGEPDVHLIEQRVHERLTALRTHQLASPEAATEAMNRLAQAFVCLTDPKAKRTYDAQLSGTPVQAGEAPPAPQLPDLLPQAQPVVAEVVAVEEVPSVLPVQALADPLAWLYGPWTGFPGETPVPGRMQTEVDLKPLDPTVVVPIELPAPGSTMLIPPPVPVSPASEPADQPTETKQLSPPALRSLGTKRALYHHVARTRKLLHAWEQAGKYFTARTKLMRRSQAVELLRQLGTIRQLLAEFGSLLDEDAGSPLFRTLVRQLFRESPPLLGQAGQPGYLVLTLARQQMIIQTFQALLPSQREVLARDWEAGYALLSAHRRLLRHELRSFRRKSWLGRALRAVRACLTAEPGWLLLLLAWVAFVVALWATFGR